MALEIETLTLGELATNCYLAWDEEEKTGIIIDPADEGDFISQKILEFGFKPKAIILTHGHFDHCLGLLEVKLNFPVPIYLHAGDWPLFKKVRQNTKHWLGQDPGPIPSVDREITEKTKFSFGSQEFSIIPVPGHTPGSVALTNGLSTVFSGDTLFKNSIGRTDFSYSDPEKIKQSLEKLFALPGWCRVYPGHGESTLIRDELTNFPIG